MPELPEVASYRLLAERAALRRQIDWIERLDRQYVRADRDVDGFQQLIGHSFIAARRRGKVLLLDSDAGPTLGLRFGMSGTLVVDGEAGVEWLLFTSGREEQRWERFVLRFSDWGRLAVRDPRRLGRAELDPDESRFGIDVMDLTPARLRSALDGSRAPLKARLLDQSRIAGVGNLMADETLWRAGLDPSRPAGSLTPTELRRLYRHLIKTTADLVARGGSHTGDMHPARVIGGRCPRDGTPMIRRTVGGRTTWSCPLHQR